MIFGKIYRIMNDEGQIYIGSTEQKIKRRLQNHKADKTQYEKGNKNFRTSFIILNGSNPRIELIKYFECEDKKELLEEEMKQIKLLKDNNYNCVNRSNPISQKNKIIICECGTIVKNYYKNRHLKTKKHIKYINNVN
jgi:predicted GIY-YIG superfamily endonuclease